MDHQKLGEEQTQFLQSSSYSTGLASPMHTGTTSIRLDKRIVKSVTGLFILLICLVIFAVLLVIVRQFNLITDDDNEQVKSRQVILNKPYDSNFTTEHFTTQSITTLTTTIDYSETENKRDLIRRMAQQSWFAYRNHSWGHSGLRPVTLTPDDSLFGDHSGLAIVDSLSTLWVMGLNNEFLEAQSWITDKLDFSSIDWSVSVADSVTDFIGGLLSAYALSGTEVFLEKAKQIAISLQPAYNQQTGLPYKILNPTSGTNWMETENSLSQVGGQSLEYTYLSSLTSNTTFKIQVQKIRNHMKTMERIRGLYMDRLNVENGKWTSSTTSLFGNTGQFYQTLLKSYLQSGRQDTEAFELYKEAVRAVFEDNNPGLVQQFEDKQLMYTTLYTYAGPGCVKRPSRRKRWRRPSGHWHGKLYYDHPHEAAEPTEPPCVFTYKQDFGWNYMETSACYLGSMLALGAHSSVDVSSADNSERNQKYLQYAKALTKACAKAYNNTKTGLGPEEFYFEADGGTEVGKRAKFWLGSELAESYFILWRLTQEPQYRESAWRLALAIEQHCKSESGAYSAIANVDQVPTDKLNVQPPRFLSATLKYLYLTFSDDHILPLEQWIFNAAGHPLPICGKNAAYPSKLCKL